MIRDRTVKAYCWSRPGSALTVMKVTCTVHDALIAAVGCYYRWNVSHTAFYPPPPLLRLSLSPPLSLTLSLFLSLSLSPSFHLLAPSLPPSLLTCEVRLCYWSRHATTAAQHCLEVHRPHCIHGRHGLRLHPALNCSP